MTRTAVYFAGMAALIVATGMTIGSIAMPKWISYSVTDPSGDAVYDSIGLHQRCTSANKTCSPFPEEGRCEGEGRSFCNMWRTAGFLMNFVAIVELAAIAGFIVIGSGGKVKRQDGWKVLGSMSVVVAVVQFATMAVVAYMFDHDDLFLVPGYRLGSAWYICMFSAAIALLCAFGLAISAYVLPPEDGYQFLNDPSRV
ncbi:hypothetical protein MFIFM68171_04267 [Madurella fahalii]|uniref:Pre-mRNA splicing factor n=1 Tax=Madurella fahalii TaxID=1157608 RepID=A0ABQ0G8I7_9PEZI